jgi:hypothetical protein
MRGDLLLIGDQAGDLHPEAGERLPERPDPLPGRPGKPAVSDLVQHLETSAGSTRVPQPADRRRMAFSSLFAVTSSPRLRRFRSGYYPRTACAQLTGPGTLPFTGATPGGPYWLFCATRRGNLTNLDEIPIRRS